MAALSAIDRLIAERKAAIRKAEDELAALEKVRAMKPSGTGRASSEDSERTPRPGGIPAFAHAALKANGKAMHIEKLVDAVVTAGCKSERHVITSVIYKAAHNGRWFRMVGPGTFGLKEWDDA